MHPILFLKFGCDINKGAYSGEAWLIDSSLWILGFSQCCREHTFILKYLKTNYCITVTNQQVEV